MPDSVAVRHRAADDRQVWIGRGVFTAKVLAAILSAALLAGFGYGWKNYRDLNNGLQRLSLPNLNQPRHTGGGTAPSESPDPQVNGKDENILIAGADDRSAMTAAEIKLLHVGHDQSLSTDVLMVVHVPADGSKATLLSIPRDSYVDIPGYRKNKINAAFADGWGDASGNAKAKQNAGADKLIETVRNLTGLTITHYVQVGFVGFYRIAQAIGGITVDLCHAVSDKRYSGFVQSAGRHNLNPVESLEFVRQRHNLPGGDLGRAKRARYFITAAFRKIASKSVLTRLPTLVRAITSSMYVDQRFNISDFAAQMADLSANNIIGQTIPTNGTGLADGQDVVFVNPITVRKKVAQLVAGSASSASPSPTQGSSSAAGTSEAPSSGASATPGRPIDAACVN